MSIRRIFSLGIIFLLFLNCEKDDHTPAEKEVVLTITSFKFLAKDNDELTEDVVAQIDQEKKEITATLPPNTDLSGLVPDITVSEGAILFPSPGPRNFKSPVVYSVHQDFVEESVDYIVKISTIPNDEAKIYSYKFFASQNATANLKTDVIGTMNGTTINFDFGSEVDITRLVPYVYLSPGATISPDIEQPQDFTTDVTYEVIAEDKVTKTVYTVHATREKSSINLISSFKFTNIDGVSYTAAISGDNISLQLPAGTDLTSLIPTIEIDNRATVMPASGVATDFSDIVSYEVTAEDGSKRTYVANISVERVVEGDRAVLEQLYRNNEDDNPPVYLEWDLNAKDMSDWKGVVLKDGRVSELEISGGIYMHDLSGIGQLSELTKLTLNNNDISSLPSEIDELKKLKELHLWYNKLISLPKEIGDLESLKKLDVSANKLRALPSELGNLTNLKFLYLDHNDLSTIPKEVCDMHSKYGTNIMKDDKAQCEP
ncbi:DUF5018 domain-containing protein [Fulvivirga sediminis]|uniref:Disease resistance R13L4/SHOC-2-like LRR domain-containing protein n=1 Tax=Fulvivirga sediminis TaxID=2803949 RepID=A0A937F9I0_9BACT|nr:hypothetical protein [Fulvivirga sediminis]MBL3658791.1 hypothetical protein [Fulvivirga sediminis]